MTMMSMVRTARKMARKRRMKTMMRNRRNFHFCKCAVTEDILKIIKKEKKHKKNTFWKPQKKNFKKPNNIIKKKEKEEK